jgi:hypothetical protein
MTRIQNYWRSRWWVGGSLLLIALSIGLLTMFRGSFSDEGDNLATGLLLSRGYILYRDVFSHHFPFAYYWSAVVASLLGTSIAGARISLLAFQIGLFAWAMYLTRYRLIIGLFSIIWSVVGLFYLSNLMLYPIFSGTTLTVIFVVSVAILNRRIVAGKKELATLGILSVVAILADPLSIYPVGCLLLFLALSPAGLKGSVIVALCVGVGLGLYAGYLVLSGSVNDFYQQTILFNANIYGKYVQVEPLRLVRMPQLAGSLLNIGQPKWVLYLDPMLGLEGFDPEINHWLFTGFLFRLTVILSAGILFLRHRFLLAMFVYFYAVALLLISEENFRTIPFVMTACFLAAWLVVEDLGSQIARPMVQPQRNRAVAGFQFISTKLLPWSARIVIGCGFSWLLARGLGTIVQEWDRLTYAANFSVYGEGTNYVLRDLTCGHRDVSLGYYPGDPNFNYLTGLRPISKYLYLFPWVAEIAVPDLLDSLKAGKSIVHVDWEYAVWDKYRIGDYLSVVKTYLDENYKLVSPGFYVSPDLVEECHIYTQQVFPHLMIPGEIPEGELLPGRKFLQTFTSECAGLSVIKFLPATYRRSITSTLNVRFKDLDANEQLFESTILGSQIIDNQWSEITFAPLPDSKGKHYRITFVSSDATPGNAMGIWRSKNDTYPGGEAMINDKPLKADWVFQYGCGQ